MRLLPAVTRLLPQLPLRRPLIASDAAPCLAALPALADRGDVVERAGTRRKEEATVGAIFTEISQSWSVHESCLDAKKCTMTDRRGISVLQNVTRSASFRLLGFNVADEATAALDSIEITAGATERQPVLVAVRGAGGGKSRAVEEVVVELNKRALPASMGDHVADPGVLGIAITFNHNWDGIVPLHDRPADQRPKNQNVHMAIEVASRVLSVLYGQPLDIVEEATLKHTSTFSQASSHNVKSDDVVRAVLAHAARRVGDARGQPVTKLVLCIDEAKKGVAGVFGESAVSKKEALDNLRCLYKPATNLPIITSANVDGIGESVVDCGVCVTSLVTLPQTSTGRTIVLRALSDVKPADVSDSWMEDDDVHQSWKEADLKTTAVRELLATIAAPLPRVLECITVELRTAEGAPTGGDARARSRGMIDSVLGKVRMQHGAARLPPESLLFDAVC